MEEVTIQKMVHGGQGLGVLPDGRKVFVWNALPGETVQVRLIRSKKDYAEGIAEEIMKPSAQRIKPEEPGSYLATSPWQMMSFAAENTYKKEIISETFVREKVTLADFKFVAGKKSLGYRSKMEFGVWGDDDGISLAHFVRGSHGKTKVTGSILASPQLNATAAAVMKEINSHKMRAGDIKSLLIRTDQAGNAVAALFVKREDFTVIKRPLNVQGLVVYYSNPKSPASVPTKLLYQDGDRTLTDTVLGAEIMYDVLSFFQVNLPVFELAVQQIDHHLKGLPKIDLYSGVGSIGVALKDITKLIESDAANIEMANTNVMGTRIQVIHAPSEKALDHITGTEAVIVDPPRAGLHPDVTAKLIEAKPPIIAYLSCNPSTHARDVKMLLDAGYELQAFEGYNFFPRTPHIETLAILTL